MDKQLKWAAELNGVREVSLLGSASLPYWTEKLALEKLRPLEENGQAQVLIIAADARFMGLRFKEISVSIVVEPVSADTSKQQSFLVHAFNSRRLFAFCERTFFATPYYYGHVSSTTAIPASLQVADDCEILFHAAMKSTTVQLREPSRSEHESWQGPVFLPSVQRGANGTGRFFVARIQGLTKTYPFLPGVDECIIRRRADHPVLESLIDSKFVPREWLIRQSAQHAKSKTYSRSKLVAS